MENHTEVQTEPVRTLGLHCTQIVLDEDISKALNAEAMKMVTEQLPGKLKEAVLGSVGPEAYAPEKVVEYVKEYLTKSSDRRYYLFKDDDISVHWEDSESRWYVKLYHWELPTPIFDAEFQKLLKSAKAGKAKIPIPEPEEDSFDSIDVKKLEIANDLLSRSKTFVKMPDSDFDPPSVEEGDKIKVEIDDQSNPKYTKTFVMDSTFNESHQLYNALLGAVLNEESKVGIVDTNYEPRLLTFKVVLISRPLEEVEDLEEITTEVVQGLGYDSLEEFHKNISVTASAGLDEDRLIALINGVDSVFSHFSDLPDLPVQLILVVLSRYPYLDDAEGVKNYFINKGIAEAFLSFEEDDPSIVNMFVKAWALKRITFKDVRDPSLWNLIDDD